MNLLIILRELLPLFRGGNLLVMAVIASYIVAHTENVYTKRTQRYRPKLLTIHLHNISQSMYKHVFAK